MEQVTVPEPDRIIREREERDLTGICRTTRYELEKAGNYPASVRLTGRARGRWLSEVKAWLVSRERGIRIRS